ACPRALCGQAVEGDRDARAKAFAPKGGGAVEGAGQAHSGTPPASPARGPQPAAPGGPRPARRRRRPRWRPRRQAPAPPAAGIAGARSGGLPPSSGPPSGRPAAQAGPRGGSTRRRGRSTSRTARRRGGCGSGSWSPGCETFSQASSSALKAPTSRPSVNDSALVTLPMAAASSAGSCPARTASQLHRSELFPSSGCGTRPCSTSARPRSADCPGPGRPGTPRARQRPRGRAPCSEEVAACGRHLARGAGCLDHVLGHWPGASNLVGPGAARAARRRARRRLPACQPLGAAADGPEGGPGRGARAGPLLQALLVPRSLPDTWRLEKIGTERRPPARVRSSTCAGGPAPSPRRRPASAPSRGTGATASLVACTQGRQGGAGGTGRTDTAGEGEASGGP
ncbi:unnamed protein product, partial [Prorocentrum cordatum]